MTAAQLGKEGIYPWLFEKREEYYRGMTYRHWLIGIALQGLLANPNEYTPNSTAESALEYADAILARLAKESEAQNG